MKVKDVIKNLGHLHPEADIVMAWWDKDAFPDVAYEDWSYAVDRVDSKMAWSQAHEDIEMNIEWVLATRDNDDILTEESRLRKNLDEELYNNLPRKQEDSK